MHRPSPWRHCKAVKVDGNGLYTDHLRGGTVERGHRCDKRGNGSSLVLGATKKKWREGVSMYNKKEEAIRNSKEAGLGTVLV